MASKGTPLHDSRRLWILKQFGLDGVDHQALIDAQDGLCAICRGENPSGKRLSLDHDHATHTLRGLLCNRCNMGLGYFKDDVALLQAAISYVEDPPAPKTLSRRSAKLAGGLQPATPGEVS